jgi:crotonobetainyl-CoA:carnitine CoA-transferase CaiB-like acyl-CoA transferase
VGDLVHDHAAVLRRLLTASRGSTSSQQEVVMALPFEGIRVLEMTVFQQGTYPGALLGDLGADVVKIEGPDSPDPGRQLMNFAGPDYNAYFHTLNRGKRAICLDLKTESGRNVLYKLVETADVFVSNLRLKALQRLGADYPSLSRINPRIIYGRASGYGPKGPDSGLASMDILGQARGGLMSVNGDPAGPPRTAGADIADHTGALTMAFGIATALLHRERTGEGQEVDASLLGGQLCIQSHNITYSWWSGKLPVRRAHHLPSATWNWYEASDGKWFTIGMNRQMYWPGICKVIDRPEWLEDERYGSLESRLEHGDELYAAMQDIFHTKPRSQWISAFAEADLAATPVNNYHELAEDPQVVQNYVDYVERPDGGGKLPMVGTPVIFGKTPGYVHGMGPEFGQHTEEVLLEAGFDWDAIEALREEGAIGARD